MDINRHNYEIFFIDYFDGNLSDKQIEELMKFISINNDLEEEFYEFNDITLNPEKIIFEKSYLKKSENDFIITKENFEDCCIAKIEGDLLSNQERVFEKYIDLNPEKSKIYNQYQKTKLEPELSIVFKEKAKIKRYFIGKTKINKLFVQYISAAAVVIILIFLFANLRNNNKLNKFKQNVSFANIKNFREVIIPKSNFSVIKTETPSIVSESNNKKVKNINNTKNNNYQYVDHNNAIFLSDLVNNLSSYSTKSQYDVYIKSAKNNSENYKNQKEPNTYNKVAINNENIVYISPKQISIVSGELNSEVFLNTLIENLNIDINNNQSSNNNRLTFWDIAETGLKSYGILTGKKVILEKKYNKKGKLTSLDINTTKFEFSRKFKK